jgi:hypothetical protein
MWRQQKRLIPRFSELHQARFEYFQYLFKTRPRKINQNKTKTYSPELSQNHHISWNEVYTVLLLMCEFEKHDFILMRITCWPIERRGEKCERITVWFRRRENCVLFMRFLKTQLSLKSMNTRARTHTNCRCLYMVHRNVQRIYYFGSVLSYVTEISNSDQTLISNTEHNDWGSGSFNLSLCFSYPARSLIHR